MNDIVRAVLNEERRIERAELAAEVAIAHGANPVAAEIAAFNAAGLPLPQMFRPGLLSAVALQRTGHNPFNFPWIRHLPPGLHLTGMPFLYRNFLRAALLRELEERHHFNPAQTAAIMHAIDALWNGHAWPKDPFVWDFAYGNGLHGLAVRGPNGFVFLDAMGHHWPAWEPAYRPPEPPHSHGQGLVEA
jgi:hypothetical protein